MNLNQLLVISKSFAKFAKLDPFRNVEHDLEEALDYVGTNFLRLKDGKDLMDLPLDWLELEYIYDLPISKLYDYDDVNSFLEFESKSKSLKSMSKNDKIQFLKTLRGSHATKWLTDGIPAIILFDFPQFKGIGDGRGRVNFAIGMNYSTVPAVIVKLKPNHFDDIEYFD